MKSSYQSILFRDIETVPGQPHFSLLGEREKEVFIDRFRKQINELMPMKEIVYADNFNPEIIINEFYQNNATLHAEFSKIVSTGLGYISGDELRIKTVVSKDEKAILEEDTRLMLLPTFTRIAGHNSDDFDNPFTCRRMIINGMKIPALLDPTGKKPWEMNWIDTMKTFGYGSWNYKISLDRLCFALGIDTPKGDVDGSQVKDLFYGATPGKEDLPFGKFDKEESRFAQIAKYQAGDIVATVNCFLRLNNEPIIPPNKIVLV